MVWDANESTHKVTLIVFMNILYSKVSMFNTQTRCLKQLSITWKNNFIFLYLALLSNCSGKLYFFANSLNAMTIKKLHPILNYPNDDFKFVLLILEVRLFKYYNRFTV